MIDLIIYGYLNVKTAKISLNGEIMGISLSGLSLLSSLISLPLILIFMVFIFFRNY